MPSEYSLMLNWGIGVCLVMMVVWILRYKKKGVRAIVMAGAFLDFALALALLRDRAPSWMIIGSFVLLLGLLAGDATLRTATEKK